MKRPVRIVCMEIVDNTPVIVDTEYTERKRKQLNKSFER